MTSNKQLHAYRAIAIKSTGPRSQVGRARSRVDSRTRSLTAEMLIIVGENAVIRFGRTCKLVLGCEHLKDLALGFRS